MWQPERQAQTESTFSGWAPPPRAPRERELLAALEAVGAPVAIAERSGKLVYASSSAERLFASGGWGALERRVSRALLPADPAANVVELRMARPPRRLLRLPCEGGRWLTVVVSELGGGPRGRLLLTFPAVSAAPFRLDPDLVAQYHGLTPTEAAIAVALTEGATVTNIAGARGCSAQTVRTHLKRLLDKLDCCRQADLVRILLSNPALHQHPADFAAQ